MDFNAEQSLSIDTIDKNICVVAGAGTGKTAILTHRFVNIIKKSKDSPSDTLKSILAITFTKKATEEMHQRISKEIEKLELEDDRYKNLVNFMTFSNISTIDSFCKNVIDENSLEVGLPSDYELVSENEGSQILDEVINQILEKHYIEDIFLKEYMVVNNYLRINEISRDIKKVFLTIQNKGYDFDVLLSTNPLNNLDPLDYLDFLKKINLYYDYLIDNKIVNGRNKIVQQNKAGLFGALQSNDENLRFESLNILRDSINTINKDSLESKNYYLGLVNDQLLTFESDSSYYYEMLNSILKEIDKNFRDRKLREGKLQFIDLLYLTRELFKNPHILNHYKEKYKYIMIDEFQDTNQIQVDIFYKLCTNNVLLDRNNLFVVGDPKQSIYGFRGSDLSVFKKSIEDIKNSGGKVIILKENYRSSKELIKYSNTLFTKIMMDRYSPLNGNYEGKEKQVDFFDLVEIEYSEADVVAKIILDLINDGANPEDIAVLFRSSTRLKELEVALDNNNISYINHKSREFYNKREIQDIILFLKVLNTPEDSESLYGLLRSNFFLIDDSSLYDLGVQSLNSLYDNLKTYQGDNIALNRARNLLNEIISLKGQTRLSNILSKFIEETSYYELIGGISNSLQGIENIRKFQNILLEYESSNPGLINEFLDYILFENLDDNEEASVFLEKGSINLMTIHGSKGLEFKTVIFYDSKNKGRNNTDNIIVSKKRGYGLKLGNKRTIYELVKEDINLEEKFEQERLLYVCVTRAKEDFIFVSVEEKGNKKKAENPSMLDILRDLEEYEYNICKDICISQGNKKELVSLSTNEKEIQRDSYKVKKDLITSSISAYLLFKRCKRQYFYQYTLGISNLDGLKFTNQKLEEDILLLESNQESNLNYDPLIFGTLVHEFIEKNYLIPVNDIGDVVDDFMLNENIEDRSLKNKLISHFAAYKTLELEGNLFFEFSFLIKLEEGYIKGSIDKVAMNKDGIYIVDFKSNRSKDLDNLVNYYKNQIVLYQIALEIIFDSKNIRGYLHFLEPNRVVEIANEESLKKELINELNSFLRFVTYNDSIDKYEKCTDCKDCKFIEICER